MFEKYFKKFIFRLLVVSIVFYFYFFNPEELNFNANIFSDGLKFIHILWIFLFFESILQLIPRKNIIAGCGKQFSANYIDSGREFDENLFSRNIRTMNVQALRVMAVWMGANLLISLLYIMDYVQEKEMLMLSMLYFLGDLVCVVFFCPFQRFIMKNRCCTVCRIFSWDHFMMYTPFLFIKSFFTWSLLSMGIIILVRWEYTFIAHPERFQEEYNKALRCRNCSDKICKIRKPIYENEKQLKFQYKWAKLRR